MEQYEDIVEDEEFRKSMGYGYPMEDEKHNIFAFFKQVISKRINIKTANLTDNELGIAKIPVRTNLEIAGYCKAMNMNAFAKCFEDDAQIVLGTSLSRGGFLDQLAVTSKKETSTEMTRKGQPQVKRGWFNPKSKAEYM